MAINYTYPVKGSPVTTDEFLIIDSADNSTKRVTINNVLSLVTAPATSWGTITGTLSTQTDLQDALNLKANLSGAIFTGEVTAPDFVGDLNGAVRFAAKAAQALTKGQVVAITGLSGFDTIVDLADADSVGLRPAFGLVWADAAINQPVEVVTFGNLTGLDTSGFAQGATLYVSTTPGQLTVTPPTGELADVQNIGRVIRSQNNNGIIKVGGAGRANATPNLNSAKIFLGNSSNQSVATSVTGEVTISNTGVTAVTGIDGNVSIQGYSPVVTLSDATVSLSDEYFGKTLVLSNSPTTDFSITDSSEIAVGTEVNLINTLAEIRVNVASGTSLNGVNGPTSVSITARYGQTTLKKIASGQYLIYGDIV